MDVNVPTRILMKDLDHQDLCLGPWSAAVVAATCLLLAASALLPAAAAAAAAAADGQVSDTLKIVRIIKICRIIRVGS